MPWVLTFEGQEWREGSLTIDQCERIEKATDESWLVINPLRSAKHCRAILETLLIDSGLSEEEAKQKVGATRADQLLDGKAIRWVEDDLPDTYEDGNPTVGEPLTVTSSGSPETSSGPQK